MEIMTRGIIMMEIIIMVTEEGDVDTGMITIRTTDLKVNKVRVIMVTEGTVIMENIEAAIAVEEKIEIDLVIKEAEGMEIMTDLINKVDIIIEVSIIIEIILNLIDHKSKT